MSSSGPSLELYHRGSSRLAFEGKLQVREAPAFLLPSRDAADGTVSQVLPDAAELLGSRRCSCVPRVTILSGC